MSTHELADMILEEVYQLDKSGITVAYLANKLDQSPILIRRALQLIKTDKEHFLVIPRPGVDIGYSTVSIYPRARSMVREFLDNEGGFTSIEQKQNMKIAQHEAHKKEELEALRAGMIASKASVKYGARGFWFSVISGTISIIVSVIALIMSLRK